MNDQTKRWHEMASRLGVKVIAPASVLIDGEHVAFTALLPQFGGQNGMIADLNWIAVSPYAQALLKLGYGFSAVEMDAIPDDEGSKLMLRDWGWTGAGPRPNWW